MLYLMKNILTNPAVWKKMCSNCRCQGACVASIKPEYLLEPRDYHLWKQMQKQLKLELAKQGEVNQANKMEEEEELEEDVFEAVSKRSWTDVLLQLLKVTSGAVYHQFIKIQGGWNLVNFMGTTHLQIHIPK